jgi:hypothetical protein
MRWSTLPVAGGLYDQHPRLLAEWGMIFQARAQYEKVKAEKEKRQTMRGGSKR